MWKKKLLLSRNKNSSPAWFDWMGFTNESVCVRTNNTKRLNRMLNKFWTNIEQISNSISRFNFIFFFFWVVRFLLLIKFTTNFMHGHWMHGVFFTYSIGSVDDNQVPCAEFQKGQNFRGAAATLRISVLPTLNGSMCRGWVIFETTHSVFDIALWWWWTRDEWWADTIFLRFCSARGQFIDVWMRTSKIHATKCRLAQPTSVCDDELLGIIPLEWSRLTCFDAARFGHIEFHSFANSIFGSFAKPIGLF